jgi:hypothetical protein
MVSHNTLKIIAITSIFFFVISQFFPFYYAAVFCGLPLNQAETLRQTSSLASGWMGISTEAAALSCSPAVNVFAVLGFLGLIYLWFKQDLTWPRRPSFGKSKKRQFQKWKHHKK